MRRFLLALYLALSCFHLSLAQDVRTVVFHTAPEGAQVHLLGMPSKDGLPFTIGVSGQKSHPLPRQWFFEGDNPVPRTLEFSLPGHEPQSASVTWNDLESGEWHKSDPWPLKPDNLFHWLLDHLILTGSVLAVVVSLSATVLLYWRREWARRRIVIDQDADPMVGSDFDEYIISGRLGEGGFGQVYKALPAKRPRAADAVALKVVQSAFVSDPTTRQRFLREAKICCDVLKHPNIVKGLRYGTFQDKPFIVLEFLPGGTLEQRLLKAGRFSAGELLKLAEQILPAVQYGHDRKIVHRDLKPANIMFDGAGNAKVTDFGLAKPISGDTVTQAGMAQGTLHYTSLEQLSEVTQPYNDQFSLGVIFYELLCGVRPYPDGDPNTLLARKFSFEPYPTVAQRVPTLCLELSQLVDRMMAAEHDQRFPDLTACLSSLREVVRV